MLLGLINVLEYCHCCGNFDPEDLPIVASGGARYAHALLFFCFLAIVKLILKLVYCCSIFGSGAIHLRSCMENGSLTFTKTL